MVLAKEFKVVSPNVKYSEEAIESTYDYQTTDVELTESGAWELIPKSVTYQFKTDRRVPKLGWGV